MKQPSIQRKYRNRRRSDRRRLYRRGQSYYDESWQKELSGSGRGPDGTNDHQKNRHVRNDGGRQPTITDRGNKGFGSTDLPPKRTIAVEQVEQIMCQLYVNSRENRLFSESEIGRNPWLLQEEVMASSPMISKTLLQE